MLLYLTNDTIGAQTGGGKVTQEELKALQTFASGDLVMPLSTAGLQGDPFDLDRAMLAEVKKLGCSVPISLTHAYAGCLTETVAYLKSLGCKITYTVAAHDRLISRQEHEGMGLTFPYPHLTEKKLWERYIGGYALADAIITPGRVPQKTVRDYGPLFTNKRVEVIPHGVDLPEEPVKLPPKQLVVGYMGSLGADKGVRYLLEAWKTLNYKDGSLLCVAGRDSAHPYFGQLCEKYGGGNISTLGYVKNVADFYNTISLYIQSSATEGFGLEVLEAMAYGRPVLCSDGAGACDTVPEDWVFKAGDAAILAKRINQTKEKLQTVNDGWYEMWRTRAAWYRWPNVANHYQKLWKGVCRA